MVAHFAKNNMSGPLSIFEGRDNIFKCFGIEEECDKQNLIKAWVKFSKVCKFL